ncbi:MAG: SpoIIE family protein phosphatase [Planctomycetaceae bacterium]
MPTLVSPFNAWIAELVPRLEQALGWPIRFQAGDDDSAIETADCWQCLIDDGLQVVGRLTLQLPADPRRDAGFSAARETAELFADMLSRLAKSTRCAESHRQDVSALVELGRTIPRSDDFRTALGQLLQVVTQLSGMWSAAFFLLDPRDDRLELRATYRIPSRAIPQPVRSRQATGAEALAWQRGALILTKRDYDSRQWLPDPAAVGVAVPVIVDAELIGTLWCYDRRERRIDDREIHVLQSAAAQIAAVLERTALLEESAQRRQLKSDLRVASRTLPVGLLQLPPAEWGLDLAVRSATVTEVGGDLCDVIPIGEERTLIAIGDAVGHSVPAAMLVSVARGALRALTISTAGTDLTVANLMTGLNRALYGVTRAEQFVTLVLGIVDSRARTFSYVNAGHPPLLLLRGGEWNSLESHGLFLGVKTRCELFEHDARTSGRRHAGLVHRRSLRCDRSGARHLPAPGNRIDRFRLRRSGRRGAGGENLESSARRRSRPTLRRSPLLVLKMDWSRKCVAP